MSKYVRRRLALIEALDARVLLHASAAMAKAIASLASPTSDVVDAKPKILKTSDYVKGRGTGTSSAADTSFHIDVVYAGNVSSYIRDAMAVAVAKWEKILTGDIPDINVPGVGIVDDVRVTVSTGAIDGAYGILAQSNTDYLRPGPNYLPATGHINFDFVDYFEAAASNILDGVATHEMGHVLGLPNLIDLQGLRDSSDPALPKFKGATAMAEYRATHRVPVGTEVELEPADGGEHWREYTYGAELMTPLTDGPHTPLSRMTAGAMLDFGYPKVNVDAADIYDPPGGNDRPVIGALLASQSSVQQGQQLLLQVDGGSDADGIKQVSFYRESNGIPGLQATGSVTPDTFIVTDTTANYVQLIGTDDFIGNTTFYAQAIDPYGALSVASSVTVNVAVDPNASVSPSPGTPDLLATSDTGDSSTDNLTKLNGVNGTLDFFIGSTVPGALVELTTPTGALGLDTVIASGVATGSSGIFLSVSSALTDGTKTITARQTLPGHPTSPKSSFLNVFVDTTPIQITSTTYDRESSQDVTISLFFDRFSTSVTAADFVLNNLTTGTQSHPQSATFSDGAFDPGSVRIDFGALLADGNYRLTLPQNKTLDRTGNTLAGPLTFTFRQLAGDANNDGAVNFDDLIILAQNYGKTGQTFSGGNFDYSAGGSVNFDDLILLAQRYNTALPAATIVAPSIVSKNKPVHGGNAIAAIGI